MNDHSARHAELPRTAFLEHTLRRARIAAEQRSHGYVTLEHLLLALLDDPDALTLLKGVGAGVAIVQAAAADAVNNRMTSLVVPDGRPPSFSYRFDALFLSASEDALRLGRAAVDGALALIAVAKDLESNASAILAANGFQPARALQFLGGAMQPRQKPLAASSPAKLAKTAPQAETPAVPRPDPQARHSHGGNAGREAGAPDGRPIVASHGASLTSGELSMEDMLASVRSILEAEERKERGLPPEGNRSAPNPPEREAPRFKADGHPDRPSQRGPRDLLSPVQGRERIEPRLGQTHPLQAREQTSGPFGHGAGFSEQTAPSFGFDGGLQDPRPQTKRRKARDAKAPRGRVEAPSLVTKVLEHIPRKARVAVAQTVQLRLSKEEAGLIFGRPASRGYPQRGGEHEGPCRAVTMRISAPEGGFFIEAAAPETQWIFDRPSFLGEEAFGTWAWTVVPNEIGSHILTVSMSARDVDSIGLIGDLNVPEQAIKVRVRGNFWRSLGRLVGTVLVLLAGSGLTVGAYYALKIMGKIPH